MGQGTSFSSSTPQFPKGLPVSCTQVLGSGCWVTSDQDIPHHVLSTKHVVAEVHQSPLLDKLVAGKTCGFDPDGQQFHFGQ